MADRTIAGDALALVGFEVARAPAEAPAPPDQRFSAERARPDPAELLAVLERIGVEAVVVVELEVARREITVFGDEIVALDDRRGHRAARGKQIGSASCRERGCQYVEFWGVAGAIKKKKEE